MSEPVNSVTMKVLQPLWNESSLRTNNCLAYSNYSYSGIDPKERTPSERSTKRRSRSENMRKAFFKSIVKVTRLYDYQTWPTHFLRNSRGAQRYVGFFLNCAFRTLIGWANKLRSRGSYRRQADSLIEETGVESRPAGRSGYEKRAGQRLVFLHKSVSVSWLIRQFILPFHKT